MPATNRMKFCPFCGTEIIENAKFCMECGSKLPILNQENIEKDKTSDKDTKTPNNITENKELIEKTSEKNIDKPRKNFDLLNKQKSKKNNSNNDKVMKNFEITRPRPKDNEINTNQKPVQENIEKTNGIPPNINYSNLKCPSCDKNMQMYEKSGILSGGKYYVCNDCHITFREISNQFMLIEEPENSRLHHKLHLKQCDLNEWKQIINNKYTSEEINEIQKWKLDMTMSKFCPVCDNQLVRYKARRFSSDKYLVCSTCLTVLKEAGNNVLLYNTPDTFSPLWKYINTPLKINEKKKIIIKEETPASKEKRELMIKNNKLKERKEKKAIRQKEEDISTFIETFKSGNASLTAPNTGVMLKKNETPIYAVYNVTLREPRAVRKSTGGYGGASIRIAKGVTLHTGRTGSTSQSHDEIKDIDSGKLLITNKRLIFLGSNRTTNIDINKIVAITSTKDMIQIQRSNKQKPEYFNNVKRNQNITVEGRSYNVEIDGNMIKELIMTLSSQ